jgi:AraC family transcriptional regulator, alkane utilization regulator
MCARHLQGTQLTIGRIAEVVGYESESAFNRAFKRAFGHPPAFWRAQRLKSLGKAPSRRATD